MSQSHRLTNEGLINRNKEITFLLMEKNMLVMKGIL